MREERRINMEKEDIIKKIQKLIRLQMNAEKIGSDGEAFQVAKMVKKLLLNIAH